MYEYGDLTYLITKNLQIWHRSSRPLFREGSRAARAESNTALVRALAEDLRRVVAMEERMLRG